MNLLLKLIFRDVWYHRARISLAVMATIAMSCMIVWLVGSLDLMMLRFDEDAENYLGHYHIALVPGQETDPQNARPPSAFPESVIDELHEDKLVVQVTPARIIRNIMGKMHHDGDTDAAVRRQRSITGLPTQSPAVIGIAVSESPFTLTDGVWFNEHADQPEGVLGTTAAKSLQEWGSDSSDPVRVGDSVICRVGTTDFPIKVVGLVEQNLAGGGRSVDPAVGALYVSMPTAQAMEPAKADRIDFVYVRLREGTDTKRFAKIWNQYLTEQKIEMRFLDVETIQERLNQVRASDATGLMGGAATLNSIIIFSTLVSILIVFTALSMGVTERTRTFAMLRTVGMPRRKIAVLVFGESVILCLLGWIGGTAAGWCVLQFSVWMQPEVFGIGKTVSLGMEPVITAGIAALVGSLLSAILPAWRATRISPLEGMNRGIMQDLFHISRNHPLPPPQEGNFIIPLLWRGRGGSPPVEGCPTGRGGSFYADIKGYGINLIKTYWFLLAAIFGAVLLIINPILVYGEGIASGDRLLYYTYIGLPTQIAGCLLLVPGMILLVEKYLTPLVARLLRLPTLLLASQLSGNLWRTLGTTLALSIGLSVYSFLEISGYSMLVPYMQSKTIPDTLVTFLPAGVPFSEVDTVRNTPGIDATRFLPIAVDQSQFSQTLAERFMNNGLIQMQTSAVIFGIDIDEAFGKRPDGSRPLIELPFQEGTLTSALEKLKTGGRYCLVPDSFAFRTDVHVGDKLELVLPSEDRGGRRTMQDERQSEEQIVEYEVCGIVSIHGWLWMNKISGVRKRGYRSGAMLLSPYETVKSDYRLKDAAYFWFDRTLNASGKPTVSDIALEQSLQQLADRQTAQTDGVSRPMVKVSSRNYLRERVGDRADEVIQAAAKMPLILLTISCFGMMGTIAASVRSRRFELGILRSLGVTRFRLIRLILAEAILIAIVVVVVSAGFGVIAGWCFIGLMKYVAGFGGFTSPLTIPMYHLAIGFLAAMGCCFLAALGPAVAAGRTAPTRLLQERV